jgi:hypothetical protein
LLDQRGLLVQESDDALQERVEVDAVVSQFEIGEAKLGFGDIGSCFLLRAQELLVQLADALQGGLEFPVVVQPLLEYGFLLGGEADLLGASAGIADGQDPDPVAGSAGADGTAGAMADAAVEQRAAEDFGGGGQCGGEPGAGFGDRCMFHA